MQKLQGIAISLLLLLTTTDTLLYPKARGLRKKIYTNKAPQAPIQKAPIENPEPEEILPPVIPAPEKTVPSLTPQEQLFATLSMQNQDPTAVTQQVQEFLADTNNSAHCIDASPKSALYHATHNGYVEATRLLLEHGARITDDIGAIIDGKSHADESITNTEIRTIIIHTLNLFLAGAHNAPPEMRIPTLDTAEGIIQARDEHGKTPLHWAVISKNKAVVDALFSVLANENDPDDTTAQDAYALIQDDAGKTALDYAA